MNNDSFPRIPPLSVATIEPGGAVRRVAVRKTGNGGPPLPRLRITVAARRQAEFVIIGKSRGETVCRWDIRYPFKDQLFETLLESGFDEDSVELCMEKGTEILPVYSGGETVAGGLEYFQPHVPGKPEGTPREEMAKRLASDAVLTEFNWMAGNVLDGVLGGIFPEPRARQLARAYLGKYVDFEGVSVESPGACPYFGVEDTAPFAALARIAPEHPWVLRVLDFWRSKQDKEGCVIEHGRAVAEGNYTVAYPMAVIARMRGDNTLAAQALQQLEFRRDRLVTPEGIWLRAAHPGSPATFLNWARGVAWYFLGLCATAAQLRLAGRPLNAIPGEIERASVWVCDLQRGDGLWGGFLHEPDTVADTSGSAGIAAGLSIALRSGFLPDRFRANLSRALSGLERLLTPDGFLRGAMQRNCAGEAFQRSDYRILSFYATGLYALALGKSESPAA